MGKKSLLILISLIAFLGFSVFWSWQYLFSPISNVVSPVEIVSFTSDTDFVLVSQKLKQRGFIRSETVFNFVLESKSKKIMFEKGGYAVSKSMNLYEIVNVFSNGPQFKWITIPPTLRKEEIAERMTVVFGWDEKNQASFLNAYKKVPNATEEGMYFPDTYLIPVNETGEKVGIRMISRFSELVGPLVPKFAAANIKLDTALKIASLVQKEAGPTDKALVAGIIWNRLLQGMRLQLDATVQYAKGKQGDRWWSRVVHDDLAIDSPYNTYKIKGLPPTPIGNPSLASIEAVLNPDDTDCLYYLHDAYRAIHCSPTYEGHLENIDKYLR